MSPIEFGRLADRLCGGEEVSREALAEALGELGEAVGEACAGDDAKRIAEFRFRIDRLRQRARKSSDTNRVGWIEPTLEVLNRSLSAALMAVELRRESARSRGEVRVLRERIYEELRERPARPTELAARFTVDPARVTHALEELVREGRVRVEKPTTGDKRARVYSVVEQTTARLAVERHHWRKAAVAEQLTGTKLRAVLLIEDDFKALYFARKGAWPVEDVAKALLDTGSPSG